MADKLDFLKVAKEKATEAKTRATDAVKEGGAFVAEKAAQAKHDYDLHRFRPLTKEQLQEQIKEMPEMVQILDWDSRVEEPVCKDAVAFNDGTKEIRAISILEENTELLNASFYPSVQEGIYYRDPSNPYSYINLNDYFEYLKKARVHELNQIAQSLGAKHIKITLKAEKKVFVEKKGKATAGSGRKMKSEVKHDENNEQYESIEVASDKEFKGQEPQLPELNYFKNEPDIKSIIARRMDKDNPIYADKETFRYINSSGIKKNDAIKIEGMLKKLKVGGNATISNQVENEERIFFEYHIEYPKEGE